MSFGKFFYYLLIVEFSTNLDICRHPLTFKFRNPQDDPAMPPNRALALRGSVEIPMVHHRGHVAVTGN